MRSKILLPLLLFSSLVYADVTDPVVQVVDARVAPQTISIDFKDGFILDFHHNTPNATVTIRVSTGPATFQTIKTGVSSAESNSLKITFDSKSDGTVTVHGFDLSLESPIQLLYGGNEFIIQHSDKRNDQKETSTTKIAWTGIELHDAIQAKTYYDSGNDSLLLLLAALKKPVPVPATMTDLRNAYANNPYILNLLNSYSSKKALPTRAQGGLDKAVSGLISKAANLDVTTIADGFARFLVKRTKEELNVAFFQRFKELINDPKYLDARILFPKTQETLNAIDQDVYQFENYITTLREAFEKDLSLLLDNTPKVIEEGSFKDYFTANPDLKYSMLLTLFSSRELINGTHPGKVMEMFPQEYVDNLASKNAIGSIETLQMISLSLRAKAGNRYWTTPDSLSRLVDKKDPNFITTRFYLGLLCEKSNTIVFQNHTLDYYLKQAEPQIDSIRQYALFIKEIGKKCNDVQSAILQINGEKIGTASIEVYHRAFSSFSDVVEQVNKIGDLPYINVDGRITTTVTNYLKIFRQTNDLALNVVQKNYGSAVTNVYNIYLVATHLKKQSRDETTATNTALFVDPKAFTLGGKKKQEENDRANEIVEKTADFIKRFGNFMSNVVKAKTSEEVAEAVEAIALPVGSASVKKHSSFSLTLNSYVGLYLGGETIDGIDDGFSWNAYGITAPIGFAINKGWCSDRKYAFSTSIFLSIVDLGAPVAFRFNDSETEEIPSVKLKDIVSPGAFFSIGLPKVPVAINWGWQMGPLLRKIDPTVADVADNKYSRLSISVVVDIPILTLYKSGR